MTPAGCASSRWSESSTLQARTPLYGGFWVGPSDCGTQKSGEHSVKQTPMPVNAVDPLHLEGWDHYSVWDYDEQTDLWFAQLWRNTDHRDDPPTFWLPT